MKKVLLGLLVLSTLFVHAQSKHTPVKKKTSKAKADTLVEATIMQEGVKDEGIVAPPVIEEVKETKIGTIEEPVLEEVKIVKDVEYDRGNSSSNVVDGEPFYIYSSYRDKNVIIANQGVDYDNKRYGLLEYSSKKKITPFIFESISGFYDEITQVRLNSKYGMINTKGQIVIPCVYDEMSNITIDGQTYHIVSKNGRFGVINEQNEVAVPFEYDNISKSYNSPLFIQVTKNGKSGMMNFISHKLVIPMIYDRISVQSANLVLVKKGTQSTLFSFTGEQLFNNWYTQLDIVGDNEVAIAELNGKKGLINMAEKKIIPFEYDALTRARYYSSSKLSFIVQKAGRYGVLGVDGKVILPLQYDQLTALGNNLFVVSKNNKKGILSLDGKPLLPMEYDEITDYDKYFIVRKNNKYGVINRDAEFIVPVEFDALTRIYLSDNSYSSSYFSAVKNGKKGIINAITGKAVVDFIYDDLIGVRRYSYSSEETFNNSVIAVKNGKYGMVEMNGSTLLPFEYDDMQYLNSFLVVVGKNGKYGVVSVYDNKSMLLPFEYQFVSHKNGIVIAYKDSYEKYRVSGSKLNRMP